MAKYRQILFFFGLLFLAPVNGQILKDIDATKLLSNAKKVWLSHRDSTFKYIEFQTSDNKRSSIHRMKLEEKLNLPSGSTFNEVKRTTDDLGHEHSRQQQYFRGIPVEGAIYIIHGNQGQVSRANGEYQRISKLENKTGISESEAYAKALEYTTKKLVRWKSANENQTKGKLVILPVEEKYIIAYKFDIYTIEPLTRNYVYINASNGNVIKVEDRIRMEDASGTAITKYHSNKSIKTEKFNNSYRLREYNRGDGIQTFNLAGSISYAQSKDFTDVDNFWNSTSNQDDAATSIHYSIEKTYDFYLNRFGRNSYNNLGAIVQNYVHYDSAFNNAFWDGFKLYFGDGDGVKYRAFASTDVVAHEFTHAVTENTANLTYSGEPGALNESFSDIFGVTIDFYANPATANFIIGDQVSISGKGIRNLANPNLMNHPDTYKGLYWHTGNDDNGGVHINCGVQNYWYYLLCNGGNGTNDLGNSFNITGIGIEKAAAIVYRNLSIYLTANSDFEDARFYSIQSAIDLYGQCSDEVMAVTNAWFAVGVGEAFSSDIEAAFEVSKISACSLPFNVNFVNKSRNATSYFWDFGDGSVSNTLNPSHSYTQSGTYSVRLIASGNQICSLNDTIVKKDLISTTSSGLLPSACKPNVINPSSVGILNFSLGEINNSSALSIEEGSYIDFSCNAQTILTAGHKIPVSVTTNPVSDESVKIWIDLNNDGLFSESEKLFTSNAQTGLHTGFILIPEPKEYNTLLRLRVISDLSTINIQSACFELQSGQAEDYAVFIQASHEKPVADFNVTRSLFITGDSVSFNNLSLNVPQTFEWSFPGARPSVSALKDPKVLYSEPGDYNASLIVKNANGEDSISFIGIVKVRNPLIIGVDKSSDESEGLLFDSGGPFGNYSINENSEFLIHFPCASELKLAFQLLDIESGCDYLYIYDGNDQKGKQLFPATGITKFDTLVARSGNVFVRFTSDASKVKKGFALEWNMSTKDISPVIADFSIGNFQVSVDEKVELINKSSNNSTNFYWNFGDGNISLLQNPEYSYREAGVKNIQLVASNCNSSDTLVKQIIVLPADNTFTISIPDQVIAIGESQVINLPDFNFEILEHNFKFTLVNSDNSVIQAEVSNNQLIIYPLTVGQSELSLSISDGGIFASDKFSVDVVDGGNVPIDNNSLEQNFKVYPNPVREKLYIEIKDAKNSQAKISIYKLNGDLVVYSGCYSFSDGNTLEIDVEGLIPGFYFIEVIENNLVYSKKFIRQ